MDHYRTIHGGTQHHTPAPRAQPWPGRTSSPSESSLRRFVSSDDSMTWSGPRTLDQIGASTRQRIRTTTVARLHPAIRTAMRRSVPVGSNGRSLCARELRPWWSHLPVRGGRARARARCRILVRTSLSSDRASGGTEGCSLRSAGCSAWTLASGTRPRAAKHPLGEHCPILITYQAQPYREQDGQANDPGRRETVIDSAAEEGHDLGVGTQDCEPMRSQPEAWNVTMRRDGNRTQRDCVLYGRS